MPWYLETEADTLSPLRLVFRMQLLSSNLTNLLLSTSL